jgi:hypothetical protein
VVAHPPDNWLYYYQTLVAGILAVLAAGGTIWATIQSANREIAASQGQTKVAQEQIATTLRSERQRVARELYAFRAMVEAAMGRVIAEAKEAREIFSNAPRFDEDLYSREFDRAAGVSRTSLEALHAREHFTKNAFSELRGAFLRYGGLLTAEFLELESLIDKFASYTTVNEEMLNIRDQPTVVRVGHNDGLEEELAVIEAKAHHLREEAAKGMAKASAVVADTAEAEAAIIDPAPERRPG